MCLPLSGSAGFADIRLRQPIRATAVSLQHIQASIAFDIRSAPREIAVHGFRGRPAAQRPDMSASSEDRSTGGAAIDEVALARVQYSLDGPPVQTFIVQNNTAVVDHVRVQVRQLTRTCPLSYLVEKDDIRSLLWSTCCVTLSVLRRCYQTTGTMHTLACTGCASMERQQPNSSGKEAAIRFDTYSHSCFFMLCAHPLITSSPRKDIAGWSALAVSAHRI